MTRIASHQLRCYFVLQTDALHPHRSFEDTLEQALQGGVTIVQLREKKASTREFLRLAKLAKSKCAAHGVPFLINDRLDIALAVGADGVHVGQDDMPIETARALLGPKAIVGISATNATEARRAVEQGADYLGIGPCYPTTSKEDAKTAIGPRGAAAILKEIATSSTPSVIIGGVNARNIPRVLHGAVTPDGGKYIDGAAVVSAIATSEDPKSAAAGILAAVDMVRSSAYPPAIADGVLQNQLDNPSIGDCFRKIFEKTRSDGRVIQQITNTVVQNDSANATLALSSSPIMSSEANEAADLSPILGALVINLGTLSDAQVAGMHAAGKEANANRKPVVFDPVGCGASQLRRNNTDKLLNAVQFTVIKGNAGEVASIAGIKGATSKGVDSSGALADAGHVVATLARQERCIAAITGKIDYVSDGKIVAEIANGHPLLGQITGSGCLTGSAIGCMASSASLLDSTPFGLTQGNQFMATVLAILTVCIAGELAAERQDVQGPGSFRSALLDALSKITMDDILSRAKVTFKQV